MRVRLRNLAVFIDTITTDRYTDLLHRGTTMQVVTEMDMGFSLMSFLPPLIAVAVGMLIVLIVDWRRNGG